MTTEVTWTGMGSAPQCPLPREPIGPGTYNLVVQLGNLRSAAVPFTLADGPPPASEESAPTESAPGPATEENTNNEPAPPLQAERLTGRLCRLECSATSWPAQGRLVEHR